MGRKARGPSGPSGSSGGSMLPTLGVSEWDATKRWFALGRNTVASWASVHGATVDRLTAYPFQLGVRAKIVKLGLYINGPVAGSVARCGIYRSAAESYNPTTLLGESGEILTATAGLKVSGAVSLQLEANTVYWAVSQFGGTVGQSVIGPSSASAAGLWFGPMGLPESNVTVATEVGLRVTDTYGALPANWPGGGLPISDVWAVYAQFGA